MVERPLSMREVPRSMLGFSKTPGTLSLSKRVFRFCTPSGPKRSRLHSFIHSDSLAVAFSF